MKKRFCLAVAGMTAAAVVATVPTISSASVVQPSVVSEDPANYTPRVVSDGVVLRPHVTAIGQLGNTMYAGGRFHTIYDEQANQNRTRDNFVMFNADTGAVSSAAPSFTGEVWAVETFGNAVYVGGEFSTVGGVQRPRLVKLNADGTVNQAFDAHLRSGRVMDLHMYTGPTGPKLFVGGSAGTKLMALNPVTGANTGYVDLGIADKIPNSFGDVTVANFSISPDQSKLVAVGNFMTVAGQSRQRAFMADLPAAGSATLATWYYKPFEETCRSTRARRLAYLTDVDFAPTGEYFVVVATGFTWDFNDKNKTVCDAAARFETPKTPAYDAEDHPFRPTWLNYTGGDTIWSVAVTGAAVYVQGHFQYLDNTDGVSTNLDPDAVPRKGIGAIDPDTGLALSWNPVKPAQQGGKQLLATADGLWVASDSQRFNGEPRYGIAFAPLP